MKKIIGFSLLISAVLGISGFGAYVWVKNNKPALIAPLPQKDPVGELQTLLSEKKIPLDPQNPPKASDSAVLVTLANNTQVLFSVEKDLPLQVGSLQIILGRLTIEGKDAKTIDLRFSDPVVVY